MAELFVWAEKAWDEISTTISTAYLKSNNKKNLRQLNKAEIRDLENLKLQVFTNIEPFETINTQLIFDKINNSKTILKSFASKCQSSNISLDTMSIEDYRKYIVGMYVEQKMAY